ncbi:MAG: hypothetical protein ABS904_00435 [Solibacillus isronensis]
MTNNNLRETVKTPSMIVSFENRKINVFLHELIVGGAYKDAFELIFSKAYYNLDFFLDGTLPSSAKIGAVRDTINEPPTQQPNENSLPDSALAKLDALTKAVSEIGKTQEDSHQTIESMMKTIENLLTKNSELVGILSELQGTMKETKEGLQVLNKFETSGINLSKVIEQNKSLPEQVAKELPAKEPVKRTPSPSENSDGGSGSSSLMAEAKSVFSSGLFSKIKTSGDEDDGSGEEKLDMSAIIAKMRRGQPDV